MNSSAMTPGDIVTVPVGAHRAFAELLEVRPEHCKCRLRDGREIWVAATSIQLTELTNGTGASMDAPMPSSRPSSETLGRAANQRPSLVALLLFASPILALDFVILWRSAPILAITSAASFVALLATGHEFWPDFRTARLSMKIVFLLSLVPNGLVTWVLVMFAAQQDGGSPGFAIAPPAHIFLAIYASLAVLRTIERGSGQFRTLRYAFACAAIAILAAAVIGLGLNFLELST